VKTDVLEVAAAWDRRFRPRPAFRRKKRPRRRVVARGVERPEKGRHVPRGLRYKVERIGNTYVCELSIPLRDGRVLLCRGKCNAKKAVSAMGFDPDEFATAVSEGCGYDYDDDLDAFWVDMMEAAAPWGYEFEEPLEYVGASGSVDLKGTVKTELKKLAPKDAEQAAKMIGEAAAIIGGASVVPGFGTAAGAIAVGIKILGPLAFKGITGLFKKKKNLWPPKISKVLESNASVDEKAQALWALWVLAENRARTAGDKDRRRWARGAKARIDGELKQLMPLLSKTAKNVILDRVKAPHQAYWEGMSMPNLRAEIQRIRHQLDNPEAWAHAKRLSPNMTREGQRYYLRIAEMVWDRRYVPAVAQPPASDLGRIGRVAKSAAASGAVRDAVDTAAKVLDRSDAAAALASPAAARELKAVQYAFWLIDVAKGGKGKQADDARKMLKAAMLISDREWEGKFGISEKQAAIIRRKWRVVKKARKGRRRKANARIARRRARAKRRAARGKRVDRALVAKRAQLRARKKARAAAAQPRPVAVAPRDVFRYLVDIRAVERAA
jgi:hypothetical protein